VSRFEYLSVLVSIVIAYAMSEALSGWGQMIRVRDRVRPYPLHMGWSILSVLLMIQWWWGGFWRYRDVADLGYFGFLAVLSEPVLLVLLSFVLTPHPAELCGRDLRAEYFRNRRWSFGIAAFLLVELALVDAFVADQSLWHPRNAIRGLGVAVLVTLAISARERLHAALLAVAYALLFAFVFVTLRTG
jgi:hypothetical protein